MKRRNNRNSKKKLKAIKIIFITMETLSHVTRQLLDQIVTNSFQV